MEIAIFVINLESSKERKIFMLEQLKGVQFELMKAIDGNFIQLDQLKYKVEIGKFIDSNNELRFLSRNEIGCALSHIEIYHKIVNNKIPYTLILEDDVIINPKFFKQIPLIMKQLETYDIINFLTDAHEKRVGKFLKFPYKITELKYSINRCSAYIITLRAAIKILENVYPINKPIDDTIYLGLNVAGVHPALFNLAEFESTINIGQINSRPIHFLRKRPSFKVLFSGGGLWFKPWNIMLIKNKAKSNLALTGFTLYKKSKLIKKL